MGSALGRRRWHLKSIYEGSKEIAKDQSAEEPFYWEASLPFIEAFALLPKKAWLWGNHRMTQGRGQLSYPTHGFNPR
jgi:hypothetical protein